MSKRNDARIYILRHNAPGYGLWENALYVFKNFENIAIVPYKKFDD